MDGPCKSNQIQKYLLLENLMRGVVAHIIEDAAKVLGTKFESYIPQACVSSNRGMKFVYATSIKKAMSNKNSKGA